MSERVLVGKVDELPQGSQTEIQLSGLSVVVVNDGGKFFALRNRCSHQDYPLLGGEVSMGRITCRKHGAKFELCSGKPKTLPAVKPVPTYRVEVSEGEVYVLGE